MIPTGRFAPSPTGQLHFGSLLAALASCLNARQQQGRWLLRIEDLDPTRIQAGASAHIIHTLAAYGFNWDGAIVFQSQRHAAYQAALQQLRPYTYRCTCSRKQLSLTAPLGPFGPIYPGTCRQQPPPLAQQAALRLRTDLGTNTSKIAIIDQIQGDYSQDLAQEIGDFVLYRTDAVFAYQLAVVVDDAWQGVTEVIRGADLLDNTPRQYYLQSLLGYPHPHYAHIPVLNNALGQKLSKQTQAPALSVEPDQILVTLVAALNYLGQQAPAAENFASVRECWEWAIPHWNIHAIPKVLSLSERPITPTCRPVVARQL